MGDTPRPFKKMAGRVEVLYFPKRSHRRHFTQSDAQTRTLTIPELSTLEAEEERARTKTPVIMEAVDGEPAKKKGGRTRSGSMRKVSGTGHKRRNSGEITLETEAPAPKVRDILAQKNPVGVLRTLSKRQLTEVSVEGHSYFENGDFEKARALFEHLVALEPAEAFPYTMLGTIYLAVGQQDRALALFEAALGVDRKDLAARVYRGEVRLHRGRYKLAIDDLQRALDLGDGDDPFVDRAKRLLKIARQAYTAEQSGSGKKKR